MYRMTNMGHYDHRESVCAMNEEFCVPIFILEQEYEKTVEPITITFPS